MAELLLDSNIRIWVFLPIIMITFLVGILRHYVSIIIASQKKVELQQVQDRYFSCNSKYFSIFELYFVLASQSGAGSVQALEGEWKVAATQCIPHEEALFQQRRVWLLQNPEENCSSHQPNDRSQCNE